MAIQNRRGAYTNFNPTKMLPGEYAIVLSGDPAGSNGYAVYMCFGSGVVERLALMDDVDGALSAFTVDWDDVTNKPVADTSLSVSGAYADAQAVGNVLTGDLASEHDSSSAYAVGDYCIYQKQLYRCTTAIPSGGEAWNSSHWTSIKTLPEMVRYVNTALSQYTVDWGDIQNKPVADATLAVSGAYADSQAVGNTIIGNLAAAYSTTSAYNVGDYCIYQKQLYRCTTAISSGGEAWNSSHWTAIKALTEMVRYVDSASPNITVSDGGIHIG